MSFSNNLIIIFNEENFISGGWGEPTNDAIIALEYLSTFEKKEGIDKTFMRENVKNSGYKISELEQEVSSIRNYFGKDKPIIRKKRNEKIFY